MNIIGIIPARYASTRFPGKPLVKIGTKTMIHRVYEQALKAKSLSRVVIATDHESIQQHAKEFGAEVVMTRADHPSGTDRCCEALNKIEQTHGVPVDIVVNIQGDEPFVDPSSLDLLVQPFMSNPLLSITTLITHFGKEEEVHNPNRIKVVIDRQGRAMYFSRNVIPFVQMEQVGVSSFAHLKHIGVYAYKSQVLKEITRLAPSSLEQAERLEQLRWMEHGYSIHTVFTSHTSLNIDTPEDLKAVLQQYADRIW